MPLLLVIFVATFFAGCQRPDHSAPGLQKQVATSRDDSLFLADDMTEVGWDLRSYEDYDSALVWFDSALIYNPEHSQAWHGRALMLDELNRESEAVIAYQNSERFDPENRQAIWHLGCHFARAGEKEKALTQLRKVIALDSSYAVGVRTEDCWIGLWHDTDFLEVVGVIPPE